MSGRHLILPHRHHVHLRAAVNTPPPPPPPSIRELDYMMASSLNVSLTNLTNAIDTLRFTRAEISALLDLDLKKSNQTKTGIDALLRLQHLELTHPLSDEVMAGDNYLGDDAISFDKELTKISETLLILADLLKKVKDLGNVCQVNVTFDHIIEKVQHNLSNTLQMRKVYLNMLETPHYEYNEGHICLNVAAVNETVNVLNVIEKKYENLRKIVLKLDR